MKMYSENLDLFYTDRQTGGQTEGQTDGRTDRQTNRQTVGHWKFKNFFPANLMYMCPCIIYEIDERYPLDATIYLLS